MILNLYVWYVPNSYFFITWKIENSDFLGTFQIYVLYDLKKQAFSIYKYWTYNRNLRVSALIKWHNNLFLSGVISSSWLTNLCERELEANLLDGNENELESEVNLIGLQKVGLRYIISQSLFQGSDIPSA